MNSNLEEMLENDQNTMADRISYLEKRVQQQDNELICLKSSLADILRRLHVIETSGSQQTQTTTTTSKVSAAVKSATNLRVNSATTKAAVRKSQEKLNTTIAAPNTSRSNSATIESKTNGTTVKHGSEKAILSNKKPTKSQETTEQHQKDLLSYNKEQGLVKLYLRGRPINFHIQTDQLTNDFDAKVKAPKEHLKLEWVYGYRGKDCRSNLYQLPTGEIVYFIAAVAVLMDIDECTQRHYFGHTDDIKCLAVHPDQVTIATGQCAGHDKNQGKPHIRIWDSVNLNTLKIIGLAENDGFQHSLCCLSFSRADGGHQLCAVDDGAEKWISVWNWQSSSKTASAKCYGDLVFQAEFHPTEKNLIVSCGKQHVLFWQLDGSHLTKRLGSFDTQQKIDKPKYVLCIGFISNGEVITGDSEGNILFWNHKDAKITKVIKEAHDGGVFSILTTLNESSSNNVSMITGGGKDGKLYEWNNEFQKTGRFIQIPDINGTCRFISPGKGNFFLIGTTKNCVFQGNFDLDLKCITNGHVDELWGLSVHPKYPYFLTCGNDRNLFYWDMLTHSLVWSIQTDAENGGIHCADIHPTLNVAAIGFSKPKWCVYDLTERKTVYMQIEGTEQIECIQYSPDGKYLACGSRDNSIYVYTVSEDGLKYSRIGRCHGHSSYITHIDWSGDSNYLMSNSGDYEVLYWQASTCKQLTNPDKIREIVLHTNNCTLSPNTIGIWNSTDVSSDQHQSFDGTDINNSCVSNSKSLLACVDDFGKVNLFSYPIQSSKSEKHVYSGHSSHVTNVKFSYNDSRLITVGGNDMAIFEWTLVNE